MRTSKAALVTVLLLLAGVSSASGESSCLICHNAMSGTSTTPSGEAVNLEVKASDYEASVHGFMACTDCHQSFTENPHAAPGEAVSDSVKELSEKLGSKAKVDPVAYSACSTCHHEVYEQVLESVHGRNVVEKGKSDGALCLDCHGSPHKITRGESSPVSRGHVVETCGKCHGSEELTEAYGWEGHIMDSYMESFHGKKYKLGHTKVPTCVSCHGAHDIRSKEDPQSPIFGANKLKTCGSCHTGANEKFVVAITHKPAGPIPHYAEKGLIVLLMSTIAFCVSHVVLEAFSDIRDVVFRKGEGEHGKEHA